MTWRFGALFFRQIVRPSARRPLLTLLNVLSIALGVAVFLAIQLANQGALESFRSAAALTSGKADLEIRGDLSDAILPAITATPGVKAATPLLEGIAVLPGEGGEYLRILGVDPLTGRDLFAFELEDPTGGDFDIDRWLQDPRAIAVQPAEAERLKPRLRDGAFDVIANNQLRPLRPELTFQPGKLASQVDPRLAAMDIGWAQELLGQPGKLTSIQILLKDRAESDAVAERLRALVPEDATIEPPAARSREMETMLGAFQLNLTAMSLVSIIVGMLLIYNSVSAAVVRRRSEIAILRACGATRLEIRLLFLCEAALEALIGSTVGLFLAPVLAGLVSTPIEQSISTLYELVRIGHLNLTSEQVLQAFGLGLGAALVAAWRPASEAAHSDPARILHPGAAQEQLSPLKPLWLVVAAVLLATAYGTSAYSLQGGPKWLGFAGAGALLGGFSLLVPWLAVAVACAFRPGGLLLRLASDHLVRALHRNAVTIASLAAAVAMTISVSVMIHSFRASVDRWIKNTLIADLYISPATNDIAGFQIFLPADAMTWLRQQPEVRELSAFREMPVRLQGKRITLTVLEGKARGDLEFLPGSAPDATHRFTAGEAVAISESLSTKFGLKTGDTLELATPSGEQAFPICGVYRDFSNERGVVMMQNALFSRFWPDSRWHSLGLKLTDPAQGPALAERFRQNFGQSGQFVIYDNASLRQRVFEIFDQTFAVTSALRAIAVVVAIIGVLFSLSVLAMEREREIGVLRALGSSQIQVLGIFLGEAFLIGVTACLSGLASGGFLSMVLTWVINKAFFGWTIQLTYPAEPLLITPLWLLPAAILAALFPSWRAARTRPARAIRFE